MVSNIAIKIKSFKNDITNGGDSSDRDKIHKSNRLQLICECGHPYESATPLSVHNKYKHNNNYFYHCPRDQQYISEKKHRQKDLCAE